MNTDINKNTDFNTFFDKHFESAYDLCISNYSHNELLNMLKNGDVAQKQIAALKFDYINTNEDVQALISNLTGCDGKIREAVAHKIYFFIKNDLQTRSIFAESAADIMADATIDINANICRLVIDSAALLNNHKNFSESYINKIVNYSLDSLNELDKFIFRDKKYLINKQLFKLYWCLEAIKYFLRYIKPEILEPILVKCAAQSEYTIREKTADIVKILDLFPSIKSKLTDDENYYVRAVFKSSKLLLANQDDLPLNI